MTNALRIDWPNLVTLKGKKNRASSVEKRRKLSFVQHHSVAAAAAAAAGHRSSFLPSFHQLWAKNCKLRSKLLLRLLLSLKDGSSSTHLLLFLFLLPTLF
jgi:invasion protein IalB